MKPKICSSCGQSITPGDEVDYGYRQGPDGIEIEEWVCPSCDEEIYDEALEYLS